VEGKDMRGIRNAALKVLGAMWFISGIIAASRVFTTEYDESFSLGSRLLLVVFMLGCGCIGLLPFRRGRKRNNGKTAYKGRAPTYAPSHSIQTAQSETDRERKKRLKQMRRYYNRLSFNNDFRIYQDCANIILTTTNFETFFMRAELGKQKALVMQEAVEAKIIKLKQKPDYYRNFSDLVKAYRNKLLRDAYDKTLVDVQTLKTPKGRINRWGKLLATLDRYDRELKSAAEYQSVRDLILQQIETLQNPPSLEFNITSAMSASFTEEQLEEILPTGNTRRQQMAIGLQKAMEREKQSPNPVFHRSSHDEDLSYEFSEKYADQISEFERDISPKGCAIDKLTLDEIDEQIDIYTIAIGCFDKLKKFCYSHGKGGQIYFQNMWEHLHNSRDPDFSHRDTLTETLEELEARYKEMEASRETVDSAQ
jgi:hypothetical protein